MLPNSRQIEKLGEGKIPEGNMFFYDRISEGIRKVIESNKRGWNFYEPNSARLYDNLFRGASISDIVKFSQDRISAEVAERLADDLQKYGVKLIIASEGREGLRFKYRNREGKLSAWCKVSVDGIEDIRDSSGAGDWLTAVFSYRFLGKYPYLVEALDEDTLRRMFDEAQYIAAMKCHFLGAQGIFANHEAISRLNELLSSDIAYLEDEGCEWQYSCSYCKI